MSKYVNSAGCNTYPMNDRYIFNYDTSTTSSAGLQLDNGDNESGSGSDLPPKEEDDNDK